MQKEVYKNILSVNNIDIEYLNKTLANNFTKNIDYLDFYLQSIEESSFVMDENIIKSGSFNIDQGIGIRANKDEKTGFAYSDQINEEKINKIVKDAINIDSNQEIKKIPTTKYQKINLVNSIINPNQNYDNAQKIKILHETNRYIRSMDSRITNATISISTQYEHVLILNSEGIITTDIRPSITMFCKCLIKDGTKHEQGYNVISGRYGYQGLAEEDETKTPLYIKCAEKAVRKAQRALIAKKTPAGEMTVILGNGSTGIMLHEAVGHGLESDFNRKKASIYAGQIGNKIASELVTVVDDGSINNQIGSLNTDDEGTKTQRNVLIENGILKKYMQDKLNARLTNQQPTGNGRRENYYSLPLPRMTNTFIEKGEHDPQEIIESVDKGVYLAEFSSGQVDTASGNFVFCSSEAYLIEKGKITQPIKDATLIGNGPQSMSNITMVGNDLKLDDGGGMCGKEGQQVAVGVGQPTIKLEKMTVGGTEN